MDSSDGHKKNGIRPACERCHQSKTACNRPEDSACARCIRLGLAADCVFHTKKPYKRSKRSNDADVSQANNNSSNSTSVSTRDVPTPPQQPSVAAPTPTNSTTNGRPPDLLAPAAFQPPILPPAQASQLTPSYVEPYFQSPSRAPSVVVPPSPLNYSPYMRPGQPPMYSYNPTQALPPITPSMFMPADPRIAMRDRDGDESIMPLSEQSATPSTLSQLFHMKASPPQPAFEPLPAASNPTQPLLQRIQEDRNSEMQFLQQQHAQTSAVRNSTNTQAPASQTSSQMTSQRMPSMNNQPPPALQSSATQTNNSSYSQQPVSSFAQQVQQQQDQQVAVINQQNSYYLSSPYPHSMQNPPLPQPLPRSVFAQFSEMDLCSKLQLLIDRRQLSIRHLHMVAAFLSEGMLEQDYIQLSALTPMPLSCSLKADFAQSESYHVWRSRAVEETLGPNKNNKPSKQFVIFFDFSDSPLLCVEDEEAAAGMHTVSHLNQMARTPQTATYTMRTSRNICASTKTNCTSGERLSERSSRKRKRSKRSKKSEASTSSRSSHSSDSESDDSHESPRSTGRVPTVEESRQELEELILRRRAAFEGSSLPSSYEEQYPMHLPSCVHYKKEVDATSGALMKSTSAMTGTAFISAPETASIPSSEGDSTNNSQSNCTCPVVVHRRMFAQVNREFERLFGWSQREIRDQLIHFGARRWEQRMWKVNVPTAYEVLLLQFVMSAQLDNTMSATLFNKYHSSIQAVIREHVVIADDGDLDGLTFQFHPMSK